VNRAEVLGSVSFIFLVIGLIVAIGLSTGYAFVTMKRIFFGQPSPDQPQIADLKIGKAILIPIVAIAVVGVLLFFFPSIFIEPLTKFASNLPGVI
jgi:NADH-quinone oxidoreductase subunit M